MDTFKKISSGSHFETFMLVSSSEVFLRFSHLAAPLYGTKRQYLFDKPMHLPDSTQWLNEYQQFIHVYNTNI